MKDILRSSSQSLKGKISVPITAFIAVVFTMLLNPMNVLSDDDFCYDEYFYQNCSPYQKVMQVQCPPKTMGSPICSILYNYCILLVYDGLGNVINRKVKIGDITYSGNGCSCIDMRLEILISIFSEDELLEITEPGCIYEISVETDACTKIVSGPGEQITIQRCGDEYQCCAITYEACYEWSCVGENCPLRLSSFTKLAQNFPISECPFYCGSFCNEWGQSWSLEPYGKKSETNNNDIIELELQLTNSNNMLNILNRTNKPQDVSFEVFDILGNQVYRNTNFNLDIVHSLDISSYSNGFYYLVVTSNGLTNAYKFVKY